MGWIAVCWLHEPAGTRPAQPDGRFYWDGQAWVPVPVLSADGRYFWDGQVWVPTTLSPDGRHFWAGQGWLPVPIAPGGGHGQPGDYWGTRRPLQRKDEALGWGGVAASVVSVILTVGLLSMRVLFVGVVDLALPLLLAIAGIVMGYWGGIPQRVLSWLFGGLTAGIIVVAVLGLAAGV